MVVYLIFFNSDTVRNYTHHILITEIRVSLTIHLYQVQCIIFMLCFLFLFLFSNKNASLNLLHFTTFLNWLQTAKMHVPLAKPLPARGRRAPSTIHCVRSLGTSLSSGYSYCQVIGHNVHSLRFHKPGKCRCRKLEGSA